MPAPPRQRHIVQTEALTRAMLAAMHQQGDEMQAIIQSHAGEVNRLREMLMQLSTGERQANEILYTEETGAIKFKPRAAIEMKVPDALDVTPG